MFKRERENDREYVRKIDCQSCRLRTERSRWSVLNLDGQQVVKKWEF